MNPRVLIVEDDESIRRVLADNLTFEGFDVKCVATGKPVLSTIRSFAPDLILLDLMLPDMDGFQICAAISEGAAHTPVIILSARSQDADKVRGLRLGADDYVVKPFSLDELTARMHAVMRRTNSAPECMNLGDISIDFTSLRAKQGERDLKLTQREFDVLRLLWTHRGSVVSRGHLLRTIWGYSDAPPTRSVDHFIARLRSKIEQEPRHPRYLHTVYGDGYMIVSK